jgi:hypothetical protein
MATHTFSMSLGQQRFCDLLTHLQHHMQVPPLGNTSERTWSTTNIVVHASHFPREGGHVYLIASMLPKPQKHYRQKLSEFAILCCKGAHLHPGATLDFSSKMVHLLSWR